MSLGLKGLRNPTGTKFNDNITMNDNIMNTLYSLNENALKTAVYEHRRTAIVTCTIETIGTMKGLPYLVTHDSLSQPISHHFAQHFLFALSLSGELGTAVTKPCYVVLLHKK